MAVAMLAFSAAALALRLATVRFHAELNSDQLLPQMFFQDLMESSHPISGWVYGAATFWFPDYPLFGALQALLGVSGLAFPLYVAILLVGLGLAMGWALEEAGLREGCGWLSGMVVLNGLFWCQYVPGHGNWLWRAGWPAYHGGTVVNGFLVLALVLRAVRLGGWTRGRRIALIGVMTPALLSNTLIFFHWLLPIGLVLAWQGRRGSAARGFAKQYGLMVLQAFALMAVVRMGLWLAECFFYAPLVREWPWPDRIAATIGRFWENMTTGGLFMRQWILWSLAPVGAILACRWLLMRRGGQPAPEKLDPVVVALSAGVMGLVLGWLMPMLTLYWSDGGGDRYMMNWIFVPTWMLALMFFGKGRLARWLPGASILLAITGLVVAVPHVDGNALEFPRPAGAEALKAFCKERGLTQGAGDYWSDHYLTAVWRHEGPLLGNIVEAGGTYFWCNNVFSYFPPRADGPGLARPDIQFVVMERLNRSLLQERFGGELQITTVGGYEIAVLTPSQRERASEGVVIDANNYLNHSRRGCWLKAELGGQ
jgi:hypothetical protein